NAIVGFLAPRATPPAPPLLRGGEVFDIQVGELDFVAVMLQGDGAACGNVGEAGVFDHRFAVEDDGEAVALHRNDEAVPAAGRVVGGDFGRDARADFRRLRFVGAIAI